MPAADYQLFVVDLRVIPQHDEAFSVCRFLNPVDAADRDQRSAMYTNEIVAELLGQSLQRLVDEILAIHVVDGDVFLVGTKTKYLRDGDQAQLPMSTRAHVSIAHALFVSARVR